MPMFPRESKLGKKFDRFVDGLSSSACCPRYLTLYKAGIPA